jgi:hypothetical protein
MNKGQVIGLVVTGLVVVGAVTVVQYLKKPRKNSEGFFNASGEKQYYCRGVKGNLYLSDTRDCKQGGRVVGSTWGNASGMSTFFQQTSDRNKDNFSNMYGY